MDGITIGKVALRAGVNTETLRYYERRGLVVKPPRSDTNYRLYPPDTVARVCFIKRAQVLGFKLDEIATLLSLQEMPSAGCDAVRAKAQEKIDSVDAKITALRAMRDALTTLVDACDQTEPDAPCPIIDSLTDGNTPL